MLNLKLDRFCESKYSLYFWIWFCKMGICDHNLENHIKYIYMAPSFTLSNNDCCLNYFHELTNRLKNNKTVIYLGVYLAIVMFSCVKWYCLLTKFEKVIFYLAKWYWFYIFLFLLSKWLWKLLKRNWVRSILSI